MANTVWYSIIRHYGNDITAHEVVKETPSQITIVVNLFDQTIQRRVNKRGLGSSDQVAEDYKRMNDDRANRDRLNVRRLDILDNAFKKASEQFKQILIQQTAILNRKIGNAFEYKEDFSESYITHTGTDNNFSIHFDSLHHQITLACEQPIKFERILAVETNEDGSKEWFMYGGKRVKASDFELMVSDACRTLLNQSPQRWQSQ